MLELIPLLLTAGTVIGYAVGIARLRRRQVRWPVGRAVCLAAGSACVAVAVLPPVASHDDLFPVHVVQHLLLGMAGPGFLAVSAPVTLALRALPLRVRRALLRVVHSGAARILTAPATAVVLDAGGLYALYLTGLYARSEDNDLTHAAVHLHMFLAGCLLSWAVIGVDPIRRRARFSTRLIALVVAGAAHDTLTKLMYAHNLPAGAGSISERHRGAELMYYGGTVIELALAVVLMLQWWRVTGRALARATRSRSTADPGVHGGEAASTSLRGHELFT